MLSDDEETDTEATKAAKRQKVADMNASTDTQLILTQMAAMQTALTTSIGSVSQKVDTVVGQVQNLETQVSS